MSGSTSPSRGLEKHRSTFFNPVDLPQILRDDIILTGFLTKQGGSWKSWKRRFFVLSRTGTLNYYEDANMLKAKGTIECKDCEVRQLPDEGEMFFEIATELFNSVAGRCLKLQAENEEQLHEWIQAVKQVSCLYGDGNLSRKTSANMTNGGGTDSLNLSLDKKDIIEEEGESEDEDCEPLC